MRRYSHLRSWGRLQMVIRGFGQFIVGGSPSVLELACLKPDAFATGSNGVTH